MFHMDGSCTGSSDEAWAMYAELHCLSNFTFLRGVSHPEELVKRAIQLGYTALALTDECSVAGAVRAHVAARAAGLKLIIGSEFRLACGACGSLSSPPVGVGYAQLCRLITVGRRAAEKGRYHLKRGDFSGLPSAASFLKECLALWLPGSGPDPEEGEWVRAAFPGRAWIATELLSDGIDRKRLAGLQVLSRNLAMPLVASGDVHMHVPERRPLQDAVTAIRLGVPLAAAGLHLHANGERHLGTLARLEKRYPAELLAETLEVANRCCFSLEEVRYEYPEEIVPPGATPASYLRQTDRRGNAASSARDAARLRTPPSATVSASRKSIRRGCRCWSSASSRASATSRRTSTSISSTSGARRSFSTSIEIRPRARRADGDGHQLRPRSALRDVGKALGFDPLQTDRPRRRNMHWWRDDIADEHIREAGFDPAKPASRI
jgi:DNA polymerase III alpha subunit